MRLCVFLSSVDSSLGRSEIFGLALSSAALLRVGRRGGFSSHIFPYVSITVVYLPSLSLFIFIGCVFNTLAFWGNIEGSALFLGVPLYIFDVRCFPEEAPKFLVNFILLSISLWAAEVFLPPNILGGLRSCLSVDDIRQFFWSRSLWSLGSTCPLFSLSDRGSKVLGRTASRFRAITWEFFYLPSVFIVSL